MTNVDIFFFLLPVLICIESERLRGIAISMIASRRWLLLLDTKKLNIARSVFSSVTKKPTISIAKSMSLPLLSPLAFIMKLSPTAIHWSSQHIAFSVYGMIT